MTVRKSRVSNQNIQFASAGPAPFNADESSDVFLKPRAIFTTYILNNSMQEEVSNKCFKGEGNRTVLKTFY